MHRYMHIYAAYDLIFYIVSNFVKKNQVHTKSIDPEMTSAHTKTIFPKEELGRKLYRCVTDILIKSAGGLFFFQAQRTSQSAGDV